MLSAKSNFKEASDNRKGCLSCLSFALAIFAPLIGLVVGWWFWDLKIGATIALSVFALFLILAAILAFSIQNPSWFAVSLPIAFGVLYAILPDFIPSLIDDATVTTLGTLLSFALAAKKAIPGWILLALFLSALYTFSIGRNLRGYFDDLVMLTAIMATCLLTPKVWLRQRPLK